VNWELSGNTALLPDLAGIGIFPVELVTAYIDINPNVS
jgi:hypothetical protein